MLEWKFEVYCGFSQQKCEEIRSLLEHNDIPCKMREKT